MFYFFSTEQDHQNGAHYRGLLFEDLLRQFLGASAYDVDVSRRKQNSLEYDIHGIHRVDRRSVIGEAKAHSDTIGGSDLAAFVGKALPFFHSAQSYSGLFLSTSPLSPEGEDYLRNLTSTTPYKITRICGAELERKVREALRLPSSERVRLITEALIPFESGQHLLHTDKGTFIVAVGAGSEGAFDDRFALVSSTAKLVGDWEFLQCAKERMQALQELEVVAEASSSQAILGLIPTRQIPRGLITASDWLDYRRPASPEFFVGREDSVQRASQAMRAAKAGMVLEVKSRSGVGKSSLLALLADLWAAEGNSVELHDARDVHSAADVLSLVQRFATPAQRVSDFEDVPPALEHLSTQIDGRRAVFMIDQFESTFQAPEVYYAYEYLALCIARAGPNLALVFARKDDLLTTHDEILVNLDRLRSFSVATSLDDFSRVEASLLINRIAEAAPNRLSPRILEQVLEFAQGFPWLLKRTMAHVAGMISTGVQQQELLSSGLHLEDLFEEELSELDEHERGYLTRLAAFLPATYQMLARRFEDDPFLRKMLEKLTDRRLLRFSGGTYDTYNDVFKDFLMYERLPERSQSQLFRVGLVPVVQAFRVLGGQNNFDPEEFGRELGRPLGSTYNTLRELRLAGLVEKSAAGWVVPSVVREFEHQGRLGEYIRQSILKNRVVSDFLVYLERRGSATRTDIQDYLRSHFMFVEAKDEVWIQYARTFVDWLQRLRLVDHNGDGELSPSHAGKEEVSAELGNLNIVGRGARPTGAPFVPTRSWSVALRVLERAHQDPIRRSSMSRSEMVAADELRRFGALRVFDDVLQPVYSTAEFEHRVRALFGDLPYTRFWSRLQAGETWADAIQAVFGFSELSEYTRRDLGKKLANWGRQLGFLPKERLVFRRPSKQSDVLSLFD
jgi:hypothetical protein